MSYIPILFRGKRVWEQEGWLIHYCEVHQIYPHEFLSFWMLRDCPGCLHA